ncbi:MAG TPA: preprotein translocase subunit SecE [Patescibacteria group bacterium]|nr:preprotein translocase subunit SecE [Patescibacteria group bacterium]
MRGVLAFLTEAKVELSRVNWPTRTLIVRYTVLVIVISIAVAIFLGGLDMLFSSLVEKFLIQ